MSKQTQEMFKQILAGDKPMGAMEAAMEGVKEGVKAYAPGLALSNILHDIGQELKQQVSHGGHELASALFRGDAFVMYPRDPKAKDDGPDQALPETEREHSRGGHER